MAKDYGDRFPSDIGDTKPDAPTVGYNEANIKRSGYKDPRIQPQYGFDTDHGIDEQFRNNRFIWSGTVLELIVEDYYAILLQGGQVLIAKDIYGLPGYEYVEDQTVLLILDPRVHTFEYDSQITDPGLLQAASQTLLTYMVTNGIVQDKNYLIVGQKFDILPPVQWAVLDEILEPDDEADATILSLNEEDEGWTEGSDTVTLQDTFRCNYGLPNEILPYVYDITTQRATVVGSQGLIRLATTSEEIVAGGSGDVEIDGNGETATVEAHLIWAHSGGDLATGKQVIIRYFPEFGKWIIIGREC